MPPVDDDIPNWLERARACVTIEAWENIVRAAVLAAQGSGSDAAKARDFLASFVLPKDRGDPSEAKVREVRIILQEKPLTSEPESEDGPEAS